MLLVPDDPGFGQRQGPRLSADPWRERPTAPVPAECWPGRFIELPAGPLFVRGTDQAGTGTVGQPLSGDAGSRRPAGPAEPGKADSGRAGTALSAAESGPAAEPALFVHGLGGSSANWTDLLDLVSRRSGTGPDGAVLSCAAVDLYGFGHSPPPRDGNFSIRAHARSVITLIEHLERAPMHLVGNSMGGAVITKVAALRPDLVRSLTLISPALPDLRPRPLPLRLAAVAVPGVGSALLRRLNRLPAADRTDMSIMELYSDPASMHPLRRNAEIAEMLRRDSLGYADVALVRSARSLVGEYFRIGRRSLWRDAQAVKAPALILHGSDDRLVNPVMAVKAAKSFPMARVVVLPAVGHVAMMEQPANVAREIGSFLDWARSHAALPAGTSRSGDNEQVCAPGVV